MNYRRLRIAWSVFWGVAAVLLIVLWVRSLQVSDIISSRDSSGITTTFCSSSGKVWFRRGADPITTTMKNRTIPGHTWKHLRLDLPGNADPKWYVFSWDSASAMRVQIPDAVLILACAGIALVPWTRRKRFSLRTLLIATTLVAVVLGLVMWALQ